MHCYCELGVLALVRKVLSCRMSEFISAFHMHRHGHFCFLVLIDLHMTSRVVYLSINSEHLSAKLADSSNRVLIREPIGQASYPSLGAHLHQWTLGQFQHHLCQQHHLLTQQYRQIQSTAS